MARALQRDSITPLVLLCHQQARCTWLILAVPVAYNTQAAGLGGRPFSTLLVTQAGALAAALVATCAAGVAVLRVRPFPTAFAWKGPAKAWIYALAGGSSIINFLQWWAGVVSSGAASSFPSLPSFVQGLSLLLLALSALLLLYLCVAFVRSLLEEDKGVISSAEPTQLVTVMDSVDASRRGGGAGAAELKALSSASASSSAIDARLEPREEVLLDGEAKLETHAEPLPLALKDVADGEGCGLQEGVVAQCGDNSPPLPSCPTIHHWHRVTDDEGDTWWACTATGESAWDLPAGAIAVDETSHVVEGGAICVSGSAAAVVGDDDASHLAVVDPEHTTIPLRVEEGAVTNTIDNTAVTSVVADNTHTRGEGPTTGIDGRCSSGHRVAKSDRVSAPATCV